LFVATLDLLNAPWMSAGELAERTGISPQVLAMWLHRGLALVDAPRVMQGGPRRYSASDLLEVDALTVLRSLDLPLAATGRLVARAVRERALALIGCAVGSGEDWRLLLHRGRDGEWATTPAFRGDDLPDVGARGGCACVYSDGRIARQVEGLFARYRDLLRSRQIDYAEVKPQ
jgi:DNA-binding transcriptional MerR regulator